MKTVKKLICLLLCFIICFSLCSCNFLDEMRKEQAFWGENDTIIYDGNVYKKLSQNQYFKPETDTEIYLHVTEKDVPVMLSEMLGDSGHISKNSLFIKVDNNSYDEYNGYYYNEYYAREDVFESIENRILSSNNFDGYAYTYTDYVKNEKLGYKLPVTKWQMISKEAAKVLDFVLDYGEVAYANESYFTSEYYLTNIQLISKDLYFKKECGSIYRTPDGIYITNFDDFSGTSYYYVPIEYQDPIEEFLQEFEKLDESAKLTLEENSSSIY